MLSSFPVTTTFLLLLCFIGATSSSEGITTVEEINMTLFKWWYDSEENVTYLTICTEKPLIEQYEDGITLPTLVYQLEGEGETNIEGEFVEENSSCSCFQENGTVPLARNKTSYQLSLIATNGTSMIYRSGIRTFGMAVMTSTVTCHGKSYTRAALLTSDIIFETFDRENLCFNDTQHLGYDNVCYIAGEFSTRYLCYTTTTQPELQICLKGSSLTTADDVDGNFTINHLVYESDGDQVVAHLSLEFFNESTDDMEAIIWKADHIFATSCLDNKCSIPNFTPGFVNYDVCAVILADGLVSTTSTDYITDLDADAYVYDGSPLLQFDFVNANDGGLYTAYAVNDSSFDTAVYNVTVDCSHVQGNKTCQGYFESECDLWVAVEYSDAKKDTRGNKILFKC